jgi:DNA repair protein RadC
MERRRTFVVQWVLMSNRLVNFNILVLNNQNALIKYDETQTVKHTLR